MHLEDTMRLKPVLGQLLAGAILLTFACAADADKSAPAVSVSPVEYSGSEGEMPGHLYTPDGAARLPAVLVLHTSAGPGPNLAAFAKRLAAEGYVTFTPDFFALHDFGPDGRTDHPLILKDLDGALDYLASHRRVDRERLGVVGFSFGGRVAVILAAMHPARLRAVISYYAVTSHPHLGSALSGRAARAEPLPARVPAIRAPLLLHHGEADTNVPVEQAGLLHRAMLAANKSSTLFTYAGADHLFNFSIGPDARFHPAAAQLSWTRTLQFLDQHLKTATLGPLERGR
jgi:carboxymethylenebutenolidase